MMEARSVRVGALTLVMVAQAGCASVLGGSSDEYMDVLESTIPCMGVGPQHCMLVRMQGSDDVQFFYDGIQGFVREEGYRYRLVVRREAVPNPPADAPDMRFVLERIVSKEVSPRRAMLDAAAQAEAQWQAARPSSYTAVIERTCFCAPEASGPVQVDVTLWHGTTFEHVTGRRYLPGAENVNVQHWWLFPGIEGLFGRIRLAIASDAHRIEVEYDETTGAVRRLFIDANAGVADDEVEYVVHEVAPA